MKADYDLAKLKARKNPYAPKLKKPVTNRLSVNARDQAWDASVAQRDAEIESG